METQAAHTGFNIVEKLLGITLLGSEWVLWLLLLLSVLSIAVIIERFFFFKKYKMNIKNFSETLTGHLQKKDYEAIETLCKSTQSPEASVVMQGLNVKERGAKSMEEAMDGFLIGERHKIDRGLTFLGTLGNNAPFIGLFGTVIGIIQAFNDLSQNAGGGPQVVMAGISEALVATAVGLFVAIPAVIAFNSFNRMVKKHFSRAESVKKLVVSHFS